LDPQESTVTHQASQDDDHMIGSRVGSAFVITGLLGSGAMGNVYRASQETIGRDVAIKFLPVEIASDATAVQWLTREAKALGLLNHPGIVTTFDFGFTAKSEPYLVLELVDGKSLQAILDKVTTLNSARALPIFVQICEAMSYAHGQGIIHRDLKPLNIMVGKRDQVEFAKILDFGIVKLTSESQQLTKSGEIWGSPFYMSPEQCCGGAVDNRSDIYSLGCVMFRALTGEVPHRGASFPETIARKLSEYPPAFATISPDLNISEKLEAVVLKCLRKNSDERYATMQELRSELLKLYPDRLESEATLTFNTLDAVPIEVVDPVKQAARDAARSAQALAATNQPPVNSKVEASLLADIAAPGPAPAPLLKTPEPQTAKATAVKSAVGTTNFGSTKSGNKTGSKAPDSTQLVVIVVTVTLFITGCLGTGLFILYQYLITHQNSVKPALIASPDQLPPANTATDGETKNADLKRADWPQVPDATPNTTKNLAPVSKPVSTADSSPDTKTKAPPVVMVDSTPLRLVKRKPRVQTTERKPKPKHLTRHTEPEVRPRRHSMSSDPNAFYTEFGGR